MNPIDVLRYLGTSVKIERVDASSFLVNSVNFASLIFEFVDHIVESVLAIC
jgi:hypothetical protein